MTSESSGYITVGENVSSQSSLILSRTIPVSLGVTVFVSFRETVPRVVGVTLLCYMPRYGRDRQISRLLWNRRNHFKSDFLQVFRATKFVATVASGDCINTDCFKLFFSFFNSSTMPHKLPSGLWNCSVSYYPSIHHHVACNHKTECEDGRDETERCYFSSPECQGLVALCGHCYQFDRDLDTASYKGKSDVLYMGNDYCQSLGATFGYPKCAYNWYHILFGNAAKLHYKRLLHIFVGLYSNDMSLPSMYRHAMFHNKTVLFHSFDTAVKNVHEGLKRCHQLRVTFKDRPPGLMENSCFQSSKKWQRAGLSCEFRVNKTQKHSSRSQTVSLTNRHFPALPQSMTVCSGGHFTHTSFMCGSNRYRICTQAQSSSCDVSGEMFLYNKSYSTNGQALVFPKFTCSDGFTMSYAMVCNFINDCWDKSDETVCKYPVCLNLFTCVNGECLSFNKVCDQISHCYDEYDEKNCDLFTEFSIPYARVSFPALINFDSASLFTSVPLNSNDSCPDSHYRCPGDFNDCLPVYTRCNGMYDCLDHQDEEGCEDLRCPGFFRCRVSTICVHNDHLCDGWSHCPLHDDELLCNVACPVDCVCQGHTFLCSQPFSATLFPQLRYLDATGSGMTLSDVNNHGHLFHLILAQCSLTLLPHLMMSNLRILDLSVNQLQYFNVTSLLGLGNMYMVSLSQNPLTSIHVDNSADLQQWSLQMIDLSHISLEVYDAKSFSSFPRLQKMNLSFTAIHTISPGGFQFMQQLTELHMAGSPIETFPPDLFKDLRNLRMIVTDNYKLCCDEILPYNLDASSCHAPKSEISSCKDLLQSWTYRGFLWLIACLSVTGNLFCFCVRFFAKTMSSLSGFSVFVVNLTVADFLMGVYIGIVGIADEQFQGKYLHHDNKWRSSEVCKVAGVLSLLSSEVSALIIWIISLDRFIALHFPFSSLRFDRASASVACLLIWLLGWFLALVPLLPVTSHWNFYGQTGICIPLPVTTQEFKGRWYSFSILIAFNFILFLFISTGQALIYWTIQNSALKTNTTRVSRDVTIARRLITVAVTNFLCWFPIGICGLLVLGGAAVPGEVNVALAVFILPLNSAVNPFVYTFNTLAEKRRKSNEAKLTKWLESHTDIIVS